MPKSSPKQEGLRDLLHTIEVDEGYIEYTDGGVWITDKAVALVESYVNQRVVEELENLLKYSLPDAAKDWAFQGVIKDRITALTTSEAE